MNHSKLRTARGAALAVAALVLSFAPVLAAGPSGDVYTTRLSGKNEVPPNDSKAHGAATFRVVWEPADSTAGGKDSMVVARIDYVVRVSNLDALQAGHIHSGAEGADGPVVVDLQVTSSNDRSRGVVAEGSIEANELTGPLAGMSLWDLVQLIQSGDSYVNLHTTDFPGGEIRGQIAGRGGSSR